MKSCLKKTAALMCVLILTFITAFSAEAQQGAVEKLYETYGYRENFEYEGEFIAHALKSTVVKIVVECSAEVEYEPVTFNTRRLRQDFEMITAEKDITADEFVEYVKSELPSYLQFSRAKKVKVTGSGSGSGVVISENGYIATNTHVTSLDEDTRKELYLSNLQPEIAEDLAELLEDMEDEGITLDEEQQMALYEVILSATAEEANIIKEEEPELTVLFPTASGNTSARAALEYEAELISEGTASGSELEGLTQDMSILQIDEENLVALKLSESYPESNSEIVSAGFPAASEEIFQLGAGSEESVLNVTISPGHVARVVPIDGLEHQAIEITTRISQGNSGGPSVDKYLDIEGLNTYGLNEDMRYAYMIPAEYMSEVVSSFDISREEVSLTFLTGLQMLQQDYGTSALRCFRKVRELREDTPYIEHLIDLARKAPDNDFVLQTDGIGNGMFDLKNLLNFESPATMVIIAGAAAVVLLIIIISTATAKRRRKARLEEEWMMQTMMAAGQPVSPEPVVPMPEYMPPGPASAPIAEPMYRPETSYFPESGYSPEPADFVPPVAPTTPGTEPGAAARTTSYKKVTTHPAFKVASLDDMDQGSESNNR